MQLRGAKADKDRTALQVDDAADALAATSAEFAQLQLARTTHTEQIAVVAETRVYSEFWIKAFGNTGIKSALLDSVTPRLNASAARYSDLLTDGYMQVRFNTQRALASGGMKEEFSVEVEVAGGASSYELSSDGQRRRADVVTTLALGDLAVSRVGVPLNLLVLDEIFDSLDAAGMEKATNMLHSMANDRGSIFVITHSEVVAANFPAVIRIRNDHGVSSIVN